MRVQGTRSVSLTLKERNERHLKPKLGKQKRHQDVQTYQRLWWGKTRSVQTKNNCLSPRVLVTFDFFFFIGRIKKALLLWLFILTKYISWFCFVQSWNLSCSIFFLLSKTSRSKRQSRTHLPYPLFSWNKPRLTTMALNINSQSYKPQRNKIKK